MMEKKVRRALVTVSFVLSLFFIVFAVHAAETGKNEGAVQAAPSGVVISTEELREIMAAGKIPVFDVRPAKEYAVSHIPGSVNIFEKDVERIMERCPDKAAGLVLYCNGPYCGKTIRVGEQLVQKGYTNVKKYQHGLPVWRAFGNTAVTDIEGVRKVYSADKTAVFIDARPKSEFEAGTLPGSVNMKPGEAEAANKDGRLPYTDHGTRVIVFGNNPDQARQLTEEIAQRAYWNSSYFSGTYEDLKKAGILK